MLTMFSVNSASTRACNSPPHNRKHSPTPRARFCTKPNTRARNTRQLYFYSLQGLYNKPAMLHTTAVVQGGFTLQRLLFAANISTTVSKVRTILSLLASAYVMFLLSSAGVPSFVHFYIQTELLLNLYDLFSSMV